MIRHTGLRILFGVGVCTALALPAPVRAQAMADAAGESMFAENNLIAGLSGTWRSSIGYNRVTGLGEDSSFLDEGTVWSSEINSLYEQPLQAFGQELTLAVDSSIRYANDTSVDPEHKAKLMKLAVTVSTEDNDASHTLTLGDIYANLSRYTFSQSVKGAHYERTSGDRRQYGTTFFTGVVKPDWDDFFRQKDGEPQTRWVGGARFAHRVTPKLQYGLNAAYVRDHDTSGDRSGTPADERNTVLALDLRWKPARWYKLDAEYGYSRYDDTDGDRGRSDHAVRVKNYIRYQGARINADYERVGTDFQSLAGVATTDREQFDIGIIYPIGSKLQLKARYKMYWDDLNRHDTGGRTYVTQPRLQLDFMPLSQRRSFRTYAACKERRSDNNDTGNRRERITRTFTAGVADRLGELDYNLALERRFFWDEVTNDRDTESWRINTHAGYRFNWSETASFYPYLDLTSFRNNNTDTSEKSYNVIAGGGLRCDIDETWSFRASYRHNDFDDSTPAQAIDSLRATADAGITRRFGTRNQHEVALNYRNMRFDHEQALQDYVEEQLWLECVIAF